MFLQLQEYTSGNKDIIYVCIQNRCIECIYMRDIPDHVYNVYIYIYIRSISYSSNILYRYHIYIIPSLSYQAPPIKLALEGDWKTYLVLKITVRGIGLP